MITLAALQLCAIIVFAGRIDGLNGRLDALEKTPVTVHDVPAFEPPRDQEVFMPQPGMVLELRLKPEALDEHYRDMTVLASESNVPGNGCRFSRIGEEVEILEIRGDFLKVRYRLRAAPEELTLQRHHWFRGTNDFCADGDIGVMSSAEYERYWFIGRTDAVIRKEQFEELARLRAAFPDVAASSSEAP